MYWHIMRTSCPPHQGRCSLFFLPRRWTILSKQCRIVTSSHSVVLVTLWPGLLTEMMSFSTSFRQALASSVMPSSNFSGVLPVKFNKSTQIGNMLLCFCSWDCFLWHEMGLVLELFLATLVYFWWTIMSVWDSWWLYIILFFSFLYCQQYLPVPL